MSIKPLRCPDCRKRPTPMRRWHDKENRVFNHLKYQCDCEAGCIRVMGNDRREAVQLFNGAVRDRQAAAVQAPQPAVRMTIRRFLRLLWNGVGANA